MANREACEVYIEQEIKEGLDEGKTPYSIGKELSGWVEKLFETYIPPRTIEQRARRQNATNVAKKSETRANSKPTKTWDSGKGGKRKGAGRKAAKSGVPSALDDQIEDIIKDTESLKYKLLTVNGFLGDIQSKRLQLALKKELECLKGPVEKILKEYEEFGY
jgi:hypothetical protein